MSKGGFALRGVGIRTPTSRRPRSVILYKIDRIPYFDIRYSLFDIRYSLFQSFFPIKLVVFLASGAAYKNIPPEASNRCPFTQRASSEHKKATTPPMSSGTPARPSAVWEAIISFIWGLASKRDLLKSVSIVKRFGPKGEGTRSFLWCRLRELTLGASWCLIIGYW